MKPHAKQRSVHIGDIVVLDDDQVYSVYDQNERTVTFCGMISGKFLRVSRAHLSSLTLDGRVRFVSPEREQLSTDEEL